MSIRVDVGLVEKGCCVFALDLNEDTDADTQQIKGGIVFSIESHADPETGEVQRRFITATPWRGHVRFDVLNADEVRQVEPPSASHIRSLIRAAAGVVFKSKRDFTTSEARCIALQHQLMEVL